MTSSPRNIITEDDSMHQFVDRVLVKMGKDELASVLDITLDCLEEGKELTISHSKLRELANKGMLQSYNRIPQPSNKTERKNCLETANDKITSMLLSSNGCSSNIDKHSISDSQLYNNPARHKQISEDSRMSDLTSDQSHCTEPSNLKNKRYSRKICNTSDTCESEPDPKKLRHSKQKTQTTEMAEFEFSSIRESRKRKIESVKPAKNKSPPDKITEKSELTSFPSNHLKIKAQFPHDKQHQLRTNNESKITDVYNNTKSSSTMKKSKAETKRENMPLSQRLRRGAKSSLRLISHANKQYSDTKCKNRFHSNNEQNQIKLNKHSSQNFKEGIHSKQHLDSLVDGREQKETYSSTNIQKLASPSKAEKDASPQTKKMTNSKSVEKDDIMKAKPEQERSIQSPKKRNELENILIKQQNIEKSLDKLEHLNEDSDGSNSKEKRCENKCQKISLSHSKDSSCSSVEVRTVSEPIILRLKSGERDGNDSKQSHRFNKEAEGLYPIKRNKSSSSENQAPVSKIEQLTNSYKMQNKDSTLVEKKVPDSIIVDSCKNNVIITDMKQLSSIEWSTTDDDDDLGKESSIGYDTLAEPDPSDSDYIQISSISESEINYGSQKQSSSSLDDDSTEELLSEDQKKHSGLDTEIDETCSSSKYKILKEQFQRAGLDLDKVAQSIDEQKLRKVVKKAGEDGGMLLRFPHFCPCSKKEVGQCIIILNSRTRYIKAKNKRLCLQK